MKRKIFYALTGLLVIIFTLFISSVYTDERTAGSLFFGIVLLFVAYILLIIKMFVHKEQK
jgi:lipopolysaccharide export LptBFGC system permease protein LptF